MMPYILHAALLIALCFFLYKVLLERESFYQFNRWLLISCLVLAFMTPLLEIHPEWDWEISFAENDSEPFDEKAWAELPVITPETLEEVTTEEAVLAEVEMVSIAEELAGEEISMPSYSEESYAEVSPVSEPEQSTISISQFLSYIYLAGLAFFALKWLLQICSLLAKIIKHPTVREGRYRMVYLNTDLAPCSFLHYIFINPDQYDRETYQQIVEHEKIHACQGHSLDMMLAELLVVVQWFNPAAWMLRKAIINNLEFLTDDTMLSKGFNRVSYQLNLLKVATPNYNGFLVNNYSSSVLKKRISMMNRHASSLTAGWKYIAIAFTIFGSVLALDAMKKALAKDQWTAEVDGHEVYLSFDPAEWNDGHAYTAMVAAWELPGFNPKYTDRFKLERDAGHLFFTGSVDDGYGQGEFVFEPNRSFRSYLEETADGYASDETLFRMTVSNIGQTYINFLQENGYPDLHIYQLHELAAAQVPLNYLENILRPLKAHNIDPIPLELLIEVNRQEISEELIELVEILKETGYDHLNQDQLITILFEEADGELRNILWALHESNYQEFSSDQIIHMSRQNLDDELATILEVIQETGYPGFTPDQIMNLSMQEVDDELSHILQTMNETGFRNFTPDQIMNMSMQQVDDELSTILRAMNETGFRSLSTDQVMNMSVQQVANELETILRAMHKTGFRNFTSDQIMSMSVQQVAEEFETILWAMNESGFRDFTSDQIMNMSVQFVAEELTTILRAVNQTGFRNFTPEQLMLLSVQEASHEFKNVVNLLHETGYRAFRSEQIVSLCLNDQNEELEKLVQILKVTGNQNPSTEQIMELSEVMQNW